MAVPKTFTGGERLFAEDLNDNFQALDTAVATAAADATNASSLAFGTVPLERLPAITEEKLPYKIRTGIASGSSSSSGETITFPEGSFSSSPIILTASSTSSFRSNSIGGVTETGFTLYTWRPSNETYNAHPVHWMAVGS